MIHRGFRYKLYPTPEQQALFEQFAGVTRFVYNLAWEQRRIWWRNFARVHGRNLNYVAQARELTALRAEFDWISAVAQTCQQQALRDLDRAFLNFLNGRAGYPKPRRKGVHDTFRFQGREVEIKVLNDKWASVRLPKIGWVKFRCTRSTLGEIKNATVALDPLGWHISFACAIERAETVPSGSPVGLDLGIANIVTLSSGERFSLPASLLKLERSHKRAQRAASRRLRGSKRRIKVLKRVAALAAKRARIRRDWHHKIALNIAARHNVVVVENLNVQKMTASATGTVESPGANVKAKSGLNRSILNQGWGNFVSILSYKLEERGGSLIQVDPAYTSQTCSECGAIDKESRESQAAFICVHCGLAMHADHNAAINILRRNTASMRMEEGRLPPDEVRTKGSTELPETQKLLLVGGC